MAKSKSKEKSPTEYIGRALSRKEIKQLVRLNKKLESIRKIEEIEDKIMDLSERYR